MQNVISLVTFIHIKFNLFQQISTTSLCVSCVHLLVLVHRGALHHNSNKRKLVSYFEDDTRSSIKVLNSAQHMALTKTTESEEKATHTKKCIEAIFIELELEFFIVHKEANFDLWDQSIHVFLICVSFLKKGIYTLNF